MFGKKNKEKKKEFVRNNNLLTSFDKMQYFIIKERSDEKLLSLCDVLKSGKPVLANFDKLKAVDCNYMLAFISGVVYAFDGEVNQIGPKLFLFARKEELEDGSLQQYIEDNK